MAEVHVVFVLATCIGIAKKASEVVETDSNDAVDNTAPCFVSCDCVLRGSDRRVKEK